MTKYWIITFKPEPLMGGDAGAVVARLLACVEGAEPPAFELTLAAAIDLALLGAALETGITSTAERAWPNDAMRAKAATPPDWSDAGLRIWRV